MLRFGLRDIESFPLLPFSDGARVQSNTEEAVTGPMYDLLCVQGKNDLVSFPVCFNHIVVFGIFVRFKA